MKFMFVSDAYFCVLQCVSCMYNMVDIKCGGGIINACVDQFVCCLELIVAVKPVCCSFWC